uniref:RanBP2-type domain-containing protein n=1 Tax=Palpitomonas bilix TaxID=652834 RepID=A0A7S3GAL8_9EUKA|mmetsp:Transcript_41359/g.107105  ORF Transcript_41359/g.107105 Transcript_41359/m.107105 type:complete len:512 (+) Transcript_41359:188-1723(+)
MASAGFAEGVVIETGSSPHTIAVHSGTPSTLRVHNGNNVDLIVKIKIRSSERLYFAITPLFLQLTRRGWGEIRVSAQVSLSSPAARPQQLDLLLECNATSLSKDDENPAKMWRQQLEMSPASLFRKQFHFVLQWPGSGHDDEFVPAAPPVEKKLDRERREAVVEVAPQQTRAALRRRASVVDGGLREAWVMDKKGEGVGGGGGDGKQRRLRRMSLPGSLPVLSVPAGNDGPEKVSPQKEKETEKGRAPIQSHSLPEIEEAPVTARRERQRPRARKATKSETPSIASTVEWNCPICAYINKATATGCSECGWKKMEGEYSIAATADHDEWDKKWTSGRIYIEPSPETEYKDEMRHDKSEGPQKVLRRKEAEFALPFRSRQDTHKVSDKAPKTPVSPDGLAAHSLRRLAEGKSGSYAGEGKDGKNGLGRIVWADSDCYIGYMKGGVPEGKGLLRLQDGSFYYGQFKVRFVVALSICTSYINGKNGVFSGSGLYSQQAHDGESVYSGNSNFFFT